MIYDIAAIQALYGANTKTRSGDTTYSWVKPFAATIWDGGGKDTINAANWSDVSINLNEGEFSSIGLQDNLAIAFGVTIENAIGGVGNDILTGNGANNVLRGGDGVDNLVGAAGADTLDGGNGSDDATSYANSSAGVSVNLTTGTATGGDAEGDTLQSIENVEGSASADNLTGDASNNTLKGQYGSVKAESVIEDTKRRSFNS